MANSDTRPQPDSKEVVRIKQAYHRHEQQCQKISGKVRSPRDRQKAISSATQASLLADMAPEDYANSPLFIPLPGPRPPSTTQIQHLERIALQALVLGKHHKGHFLQLRRISPVVSLKKSSWTIVEDQTGQVERLDLYLHRTSMGEDVLDLSKNYQVKEPFFILSEDGEACIKILHPSDLVVLEDLEVNQSKGSPVDQAAKCKDFGNAALKQSSLAEAYNYYARGIQIVANLFSKPSISTDLYRNRSHLNLLLERYDQALSDALASLVSVGNGDHAQLDSKAYFRAGLASYHLGRFFQAEHYFSSSLSLSPAGPLASETKHHLRNTSLRLTEQSSGLYDLQKLRVRLSSSRPCLDVATCSTNTTTAPSPFGGRGLFTTQSISTNSIVLIEKAFHLSHPTNGAWTALTYSPSTDHIHATPAGLVQAIVTKLRDNTSLAPDVLALHSSKPGLGPTPLFNEHGDLILDTNQIWDIVSKNAFASTLSCPPQATQDGTTGLWIRASYANHSCLPNVKREMLGDVLILTALRDLEEGEEILHPYVQGTLEEREESLEKNWGFKCSCGLCETEREDGVEVRRKRMEIVEKGERLVRAGGNKKAVLRRIRGLLKELEGLYDEERWRGLPRWEMERLQNWLGSVGQGGRP
ncbi:SET domain-containing protein 7 [Elsinoe fawcettii]|nr:SET domain-containing protein 7 [Elsinoe fawcettii]